MFKILEKIARAVRRKDIILVNTDHFTQRQIEDIAKASGEIVVSFGGREQRMMHSGVLMERHGAGSVKFEEGKQ